MAAQHERSPNEPPSSVTTRDAAPLPLRLMRPAAAFLAGVRGANALDVLETAEADRVRAALPGREPGDIEISAHGRTITIEAGRGGDNGRPRSSYLKRESRSIAYHRTLTLPEPVRVDDGQARYERGILEITLPKAEIGPPKRIMVASGHAGTEE